MEVHKACVTVVDAIFEFMNKYKANMHLQYDSSFFRSFGRVCFDYAMF